MSKRGVSNLKRESRRSGEPLKTQRIVGISLSGGKNAKTVLCILEFFEEHNRLILTQFIENIKSESEISADDILLETLNAQGNELKYVGVDVPLTLPTCLTCQLECPGISRCQQPHIRWFWSFFQQEKSENKKARLFTPYTQRPVEAWVTSLTEEEFHFADAMGANTAPLTSRVHFLKRRWSKSPLVEVFPRLSMWRIGRHYNISKRLLRFHKHSIEGDKSRLHFINRLVEEGIIFLYQQDISRMVENGNCFDAFITALTTFYYMQKKVEPRPQGFPSSEAWVAIPKF